MWARVAGWGMAAWLVSKVVSRMNQSQRKPAQYGVDAAGAVVWRESDGHVVLVHRPFYDDWSLPKGKCDEGETFSETAVREVEEETGITGVLGDYLHEVTYPAPAKDGSGDVIKTVVYFTLNATAIPDFKPNEEVDVLLWLPVEEAITKTSYPGDREVLNAWLRGKARY